MGAGEFFFFFLGGGPKRSEGKRGCGFFCSIFSLLSLSLSLFIYISSNRLTLCVSHQSTLGRPVRPAALRTCVGLNCAEGLGFFGFWKEKKRGLRNFRSALFSVVVVDLSFFSLFSSSHLLNLLQDQRAVLEARLGRLPGRTLLGEELADEAPDPPGPAEEEEARGLFWWWWWCCRFFGFHFFKDSGK